MEPDNGPKIAIAIVVGLLAIALIVFLISAYAAGLGASYM